MRLSKLDLDDATLDRARAYIFGSDLATALETQGAEAAHAYVTKSAEANMVREAAQKMVNTNLGFLDIHTPPALYTGPQKLLVKQHVGIIETLNDIIKRGGSWTDMVKEFSTSDAMKQYTTAFIQGTKSESMTRSSLTPYFFASRLNEAITQFGIGLGPENLGSGADILKGLVFQRILPGVAAVEAWKYLNYESENFGVTSPEELVANVRARAKLAWAGINDWERFVELHPGSEYYLSGKSEEDMEEQLQRGYIPVRQGRFWLFGSRGPIYGHRTNYFIPDPYQLAHSHWQTAENADFASSDYWSHSLLPTPRFPLSTAKHFLDPYHWERRHAEGDNPDRPYLFSGKMFTPEAAWGPLLNATIGRVLKPRRVLHPEYLPENLPPAQENLKAINQGIKAEGAVGRTGDESTMSLLPGSIATSTPAGQIVLTQIPGTSTDGSDINTYSGTRRGEPSRIPRWELERINMELKAQGGGQVPARLQDLRDQEGVFTAEQLEDIGPISNAEMGGYLTRELMGLYGWMAGIPLGDRTGIAISDPSRAYGYERKYWEANLGGAGGFLCITPDTILQRDFGSTIRADEVVEGDLLLSRHGDPQTVLAVHKRHVDETIHCIKACCDCPPLSATSEHPILAILQEELPYNKDPNWIAIKHLKKGDYIAYPIRIVTASRKGYFLER